MKRSPLPFVVAGAAIAACAAVFAFYVLHFLYTIGAARESLLVFAAVAAVIGAVVGLGLWFVARRADRSDSRRSF